MSTKFYPFILSLGFLILIANFLSAQSCGTDAPFNFTIVPDVDNAGDCFLQINWLGEMPEIACGSPGTPVGTLNGTLFDLATTVNGLNEILYDRGSGSSCNNAIVNIEYGTTSNTYISTISNVNFCLAGNTISIEGNRSGGASFLCVNLPNSNVAAPVELAYFKGKATDKSNTLQWATSSEENVSTFVIEKSLDGKRTMEIVGSLTAVGFSDAMEYYQLEDKNPRPLTYYRLKSIDFDGTYSLSKWVAVQRQIEEQEAILSISPVPLQGEEYLQVYYQAKYSESIVISITDINGRQLFEERKTIDTGVYNWSFDFPKFQQDLLILQIASREGTISRLIPIIQDK